MTNTNIVDGRFACQVMGNTRYGEKMYHMLYLLGSEEIELGERRDHDGDRRECQGWRQRRKGGQLPICDAANEGEGWDVR